MSAIWPVLTVIWPMFRRWPRRLAVGETVGEALLLLLPERVDRQLGIGLSRRR